MTGGKSTPPSRPLTCRLRSLIANLDNASVESATKQVSIWINSLKNHHDRFLGLLRLTTELVLERAMEKTDRDFHRVLGRFCTSLDITTDGEHTKFLNLLWGEEIQAISVELLENNKAEAGSWPECIALVAFAGDLCSNALLQPDTLRSSTRMLSGARSNLGLVVTCTLLEGIGQTLCRDQEGKYCFDTAIQTMLSGGGISAIMRSKVQALAAKWTTEGVRSDGLDDVQSDEETVHSDDGEAHTPNPAASQLCKPKHNKFFFRSGDIIFVCEETSFRVQSDIFTNNSQVLSDVVEKARETGDHLSHGCPCIHLSDAAEDFATLLKVFYTSGFPHRHQTPDFPTFCSLLRMATKYQLEELRSQILLDLVSAYPTKFSEYTNSSCLGETVFGTPPPHPNSVLNLFVESRVTFALPFAYYRVGIAGDPASLDTTVEGAALPPNTLRIALRGQRRLKEGETQFANKLAFQECTAWRCIGKSRASIHDWIIPNVAVTNGILEREEFTGTGYCHQCTQAFPQKLSEAKKETWKSLPGYFDLLPWDDATYRSGS